MAIKNITYKDIQDEIITIKYWKNVLRVVEAYYNEESIVKYTKNMVFSNFEKDCFKVSIPDYFKYQKREKYLPRMSINTLTKVWFALSQMKGLSIRQFAVVSSIGGSNVFGGGNTLTIDKILTLDLTKIEIRRDFSPLFINKKNLSYEERFNISFYVTLKNIKDFIDKE